MSHRPTGPAAILSAIALSLASLLVPPASAEDPPPPVFPRTDPACVTVEDNPADGKLEVVVATTGQVVPLPAPFRPHPGAEIESIAVNTTATQLQAFLKVKNLPTTATAAPTETAPADTMGAYDTHLRWTITFTIGTKVFLYARYITNDYAKDLPGKPSPANGTVSNTDTTPDFVLIDPVKDYFVVSVPLSAIDAQLGEDNGIVRGETEIKVDATAWQYIGATTSSNTGGFAVDSLSGTYIAGDDTCFTPPKAKLSDLLGATVQYGDTATLTAKIVTFEDEPLEGAEVTFTIGDKVLTATSDAAGVAKVSWPKVDKVAGSYPLTVAFAGTEEHGRASLTGKFVVKAEGTRFWTAPSVARTGTTRSVTVQLLDDDKKPLASGQRIYWYLNGRKQSGTTATDSAGRSTLKGVRPGTTVYAEFAAVAGKYTGTKSKAVKPS